MDLLILFIHVLHNEEFCKRGLVKVGFIGIMILDYDFIEFIILLRLLFFGIMSLLDFWIY